MTYLGWLMSGTMWTLLVSLAAWIIAFSLGSILGVLRTTPLVIPRALATGNCELRTNSIVSEVVVDDRGLARGVKYFDADDRAQYQTADLVVTPPDAVRAVDLIHQAR